MTWEELRDRIGDKARDIIHADRADGNGKLACWLTPHKSTPYLEWLPDAQKYKCYNCGEHYDILDHAKDQANGDTKEAYAMLCEWAGVEVESEKPPNAPERAKETIWHGIEPLSRERSVEMVQYMLSRGISEHTLKAYHVTGTPAAIYFNYVVGKTLVKIKGRLIGNIPNGKDKYSPTPKGGTNTLYGQHTYKKQQCLVICEGEIDALSVFEAISSKGMEASISVSSVPSGSSSFGWVENSLEYIQRHDVVIVVPDNDEAGVKFASKMQSELAPHIRVATADLSKHGVNDCNELLQEYGRDTLGQAIMDAQEYRPDYTVDWAKVEDSQTTYSETGFWNLDHYTFGLQHGAMTLFTGRSGDGKTTILRQIVATNTEKGQRVGILMGEESATKFRERYLRQAHPLDDGYLQEWQDQWYNKRYSPTQKGVDAFARYAAAHISLFDNQKLTEPNMLATMLAWIKREATLFGTRLFILDNLMKLEQGAEGALLESQRTISNMLKTYAEALNIHVILVAHPRKDTDIVSTDSISGSKNISNVVDNVVLFQRLDNLDDSLAGKIREKACSGSDFGLVTAYFRVAKNRETGVTAYVPLRYNEETTTIHDLSLGNTLGRWTIRAHETEVETW